MLGEPHPPQKPPDSMEQISSPLSAQILEFCESDLFPETIQNSEVASSSNCCYDDQSSYTTFPPDQHLIKYNDDDNNNFSIVFDEEITQNNNSNNNDNDIINAVSLDFTTSPHFNLPPYHFTNQDQIDLTQLLQNQILLTNDHHHTHPIHLPYVHPNLGTALPTVCEDDSLSNSVPPASKFMRLSGSFMDHNSSITSSYLSSGNMTNINPVESMNCGMINFNGDLFLGELGDNNNGIFCHDHLPRPYNSNEVLQALSNESHHPARVNGGGTPLASEITSMEAETFRSVPTKLTPEERKEKILRYLKKRNERNFSKKIKYACRKTLADSRPRVRGRFAKNDEFGENNNRSNSHEEYATEDVKSFRVVVKEEDENYESSDIFAHISGMNSFKCSYPSTIQSWI